MAHSPEVLGLCNITISNKALHTPNKPPCRSQSQSLIPLHPKLSGADPESHRLRILTLDVNSYKTESTAPQASCILDSTTSDSTKQENRNICGEMSSEFIVYIPQMPCSHYFHSCSLAIWHCKSSRDHVEYTER